MDERIQIISFVLLGFCFVDLRAYKKYRQHILLLVGHSLSIGRLAVHDNHIVMPIAQFLHESILVIAVKHV